MYAWIFQHALLPMVEYRHKMHIRDHLREFEQTQWWDPNDLQELQNRRLRALIRHAYEHVPYYRRLFSNHGLRPHDIQTTQDLVKLPILTRDDVRQHFNELTSTDMPRRRYKLNRTGGSTGEPLKFYIDWDAWGASWACIYLGWRIAGYRFGDRMANLGGTSLFPDTSASLKTRLRRAIERNRALSATHMSEPIMADYCRQLRKHQPRFLRGYPSALVVFAKFLTSHGGVPFSPEAVFTTAEVLYPHQREVIEDVFRCKVFDGYGCGDGGGSAIECSEHQGHHIIVQRAVLEIVGSDGSPVSPKTCGRVAWTDLCNYAMPFIRYHGGDMAVAASEYCRCGRGLPLVETLLGRTTQTIRFANGNVLSGPAVTLIFKEFPIRQYQVVQTDLHTLRMRIVRDWGFTEDHSKRLSSTFRYHVGEGVRVHLEYVNDIPPTRSGKRLYVIADVQSADETAR